MSDRELKNNRSKREGLKFGAATLFWVLIWALAAALIGNDILVAGPLETLRSFIQNVQEPTFWLVVFSTSLSIVCTATVSALVGTLLGLLASGIQLIKVLIAPVLQVLKSAPVACVIVIILVISGSRGALIAIVAFVVFPPFYVASIESQQARNYETEDILRLAGLSRFRIFLSCVWPVLLPFYIAAAKTAIALSWRAGITAELLCIPFGSIGEGIYIAKLSLDSAGLLMWTIIVMLLSWINEKIIVALLRITARSPLWALARHNEPINNIPVSCSAHETVLEVADLSFAYEDTSIFEKLNFTLSRGERVCLMAPTGAGKSTLINILIGRTLSSQGSVHRPPLIGVVMQGHTLIPTLSAEQNIILTCGRSRLEEQFDEVKNLLPANTFQKAAQDLSGGTCRLTEIVRAVLGNNDAIILDEPFAGLDSASKERACSFIMRHLDNRPLLVATHDCNDALLLDAEIIYLLQ